jgi:hypothetical protein
MTYQLEAKPAYDGSPLRLLQTTRVTYGGSSWMAEAGTVIKDYPLCRYMWENDYPVISATEPDMVMQCQRCRHLFDSSINEYSGSVLIYLKDLIYWYNGSTIRRLRGELELDSFLQKYLIDNKMQVAVAARDEFSHCPACGNISKKEKILGDRSIPLVSSQPTPAPAQELAPAMATATLNTSPPVAPFADPLTQKFGDDLPVEDVLEKRFWEP